LCQRKAFLLLQGDTGHSPHPYVKLLNVHASRSLKNFLDALRTEGFDVLQSEDQSMVGDTAVIAHALLKADDLEARVDALVRVKHSSSEEGGHYEPYLVVGTRTITRDQRIRLAFTAHVLAKAFHYGTVTGAIVNVAGDVSRLQLTKLI